ncbi:hypothetical protein NE583_10615, partial [Veillonella parvula]|nr:hypothetical protein [Veillonella parvula]
MGMNFNTLIIKTHKRRLDEAICLFGNLSVLYGNNRQGAFQNNDLQSAFTSSANTFEELLFPDHEKLGICKEFFTSRG